MAAEKSPAINPAKMKIPSCTMTKSKSAKASGMSKISRFEEEHHKEQKWCLLLRKTEHNGSIMEYNGDMMGIYRGILAGVN